MPLEESVVQSVSNSNFKNQAEMPMQYGNILLNDSLIAARNMTAIREKSVSRSLERMDSTQSDELAGEGVAGSIAAAIAQVLAKLGQSTPPETAKPV
jgi:hypothetical protein